MQIENAWIVTTVRTDKRFPIKSDAHKSYFCLNFYYRKNAELYFNNQIALHESDDEYATYLSPRDPSMVGGNFGDNK